MTDSSTSTFYDIDRPIKNTGEDSLHRSEFAKNLAKAIGYWDGSESLVIALYGDWGSGKTSIKNMVVESIKSQDNKTVVPIEFNPWYWSGQKELMEAFFREISIGFEEKDKPLSEKLRAYSKVLRFGSSLINTFLPFTESVVPGISIVLHSVSNEAKEISQTLEAGADLSDNQESNKSLNDIKTDIRTTLEESKTKYLIIIDDIDRLSPDQVRMMFQLIKANADFPKFVYLLMFQKDIVEKALERPDEKINGQSYLNKIIQIPFNVPMAETTIIHEYLGKKIKTILDSHGISSELTPEGLEEVMKLIKPLFNNYRDVKRFLNTLSINIALLIKDNKLIVNPVDYILIETIRVFNPKLYMWIYENKLNQNFTESSYTGMSEEYDLNYAEITSYLFYKHKDDLYGIKTAYTRPNYSDPRMISNPDKLDLYYSLFIK